MADRHALPDDHAFDPKTFVADLIAAGCHVSVVQPIGINPGPAYWYVSPADDGKPTEGEREVRARWRAAIASCPDHDEHTLAFCKRRVAEAREVAVLGEQEA